MRRFAAPGQIKGKPVLTRLNTLLLLAIVLVNGYIILLPVLPNVLFALNKNSDQRQALEAKIRPGFAAPSPAQTQPPPTQNQLIIPSMLLDQPIYEGQDNNALRKGLWHRPGTGNPQEGGNMVIVGHRLTYQNPRGALYHLDKVRANDILAVRWQGKTYRYIVTGVKVVDAKAAYIESPTSHHQLTIYTCTPLWMPKDRLVLIALPEPHLPKQAT